MYSCFINVSSPFIIKLIYKATVIHVFIHSCYIAVSTRWRGCYNARVLYKILYIFCLNRDTQFVGSIIFVKAFSYINRFCKLHRLTPFGCDLPLEDTTIPHLTLKKPQKAPLSVETYKQVLKPSPTLKRLKMQIQAFKYLKTSNKQR